MPSVDFITFCCQKDAVRLHLPGNVDRVVASHGSDFDNVYLIYQRIDSSNYSVPNYVQQINSDDFPTILQDFNIEPNQPIADGHTHGPTAAHYWKWHTINHLIGLKVSQADYIVFSDCDCRMLEQPDSWVKRAVSVLEQHPEVLIVSPSDGGSMAEKLLPDGIRLTQNVSQQLFLCQRERMLDVDFDIPWNWEFLAPGGPMQEYYYMMEGRIWRYLHHNKLWRAILPVRWRYWHYQW